MYQLVVRLLDPYMILLLCIGATLFFLWRKGTPACRLIPGIAAWLGLLLYSIPAISYLATGTLEWAHPPRTQCPQDIEAIVVLGGYLRPPDDTVKEAVVGFDTYYRCVEAARLYCDVAPCLVVASGGKVEATTPGPTVAESMGLLLKELGVRHQDLVLEERSRSTYENAVESVTLLQERGINKALLVTEAIHLPRAKRCFTKQGMTVVTAGCEYRATQFRWELDAVLPSVWAVVGNNKVLHEWLGLAWYRLKGRI